MSFNSQGAKKLILLINLIKTNTPPARDFQLVRQPKMFPLLQTLTEEFLNCKYMQMETRKEKKIDDRCYYQSVIEV